MHKIKKHPDKFGFVGMFMKERLGNYIQEYSVRNKNGEDIPVYSVTNTQGFCKDYFGKEVASKDKTTYKIVPRGCFAYNPSRINVGSVDYQRYEDKVIVSPLYNVFTVSDNLDKQYLYYYLKSGVALQRIRNVASGSVRDNLKLSMLYEFPINVRDIEEQRSIVYKLDQIRNIIDLRQKELEQLDELVKARFVELFGDIGIDEKCWGFEKLSDCCQINPKKSQDTRLESGLMVSFVPMPAVSEKGEIDASETRSYDEVKSGFTYFCENDVLFAKITPCMENGKGSVARGLCNGIGFGSTEFHVLRPINGVSNPYWLYAVTAFKQFRLDAESNMTGSAGQKRVPASFLETYRVPLPPIDLQNEFANFVKEVDKSKFVLQKALDEAQTLFDSLMQEYFG